VRRAECRAISDDLAPGTKRRLVARFWRVAGGFWRRPGATRARLLVAALVGGTLLQLALQYRLNYWSRDFFDAFGRRDGEALRSQAGLFLVLAGLSIAVAVLIVWARMTTQRRWRQWLTRHLIDRWLASDRVERLEFQVGEDRNPEYRIAEDVRVATDAPVSMAAGVLTAGLSAVVFIGILWNVGGDLAVQIDGYALVVPKYMVLTVVLYSALLTLVMMLVGRRMIHVIAAKNAAEAEFRSIGSNLREHQSVASALTARPAQHERLTRAFSAVNRAWLALCFQSMRTTVVSSGNVLAAPVIGWVLCAPKYLAGLMSLGEVAQAVAAFVIVQAALNWLVDNYPGLSECLSSVNRVAALLQSLDELDARKAPPDAPPAGPRRGLA
jgi:putative ATP-binding cassette transporter